jgi:hypothetical protein
MASVLDEETSHQEDSLTSHDIHHPSFRQVRVCSAFIGAHIRA